MRVIPAYAKINLALEVVRRLPDGWHDIESVVVPIDWHDLVGVDLGPRERQVRVTGTASRDVPGADGAGPAADNLAVRAADALVASATQRSGRLGERRLSVWLDKRVPAGAGLGGGSADAAAALLAGSRVLTDAGVGLDAASLSRTAAMLGSDVPALLAGRPVHVTGRGEQLEQVIAPPLHLVVVFLAPSSTRDAYDALRPEELSDGSRVGRLIAGLEEAGRGSGSASAVDASQLDDLLGSALEAPALRNSPSLASAAQRLRDAAPAIHWHMTGSGGAFFALTPGAATAVQLAGDLRTAGLPAGACRTRPSPVHD